MESSLDENGELEAITQPVKLNLRPV